MVLAAKARAHAARAVDDDGRVVVEQAALDLALQVAAGDVDGAGQRTLVVLVGLTDVEHDRARPLRRSSASAVSTSVISRLGLG